MLHNLKSQQTKVLRDSGHSCGALRIQENFVMWVETVPHPPFGVECIGLFVHDLETGITAFTPGCFGNIYEMVGPYILYSGAPEGDPGGLYLDDTRNRNRIQVTEGYSGNMDGQYLETSENYIVWLAHSGVSWDVDVYEIATGNIFPLFNDTEGYFDIAPDVSGNYVVWARDPLDPSVDERDIFLKEIGEGTDEVRLTYNNKINDSPRISGNHIAWMSGGDIMLAEIGGSTTNITESPAGIFDLHLSGDHVAWVRLVRDPYDVQIFYYHIPSGTLEQVSSAAPGAVFDFRFAMDAMGHIVWHESIEGNSEIMYWSTLDVPGPVENLSGIFDETSGDVTISWDAPLDNGRPSIIDYRLFYKKAGTTGWTKLTNIKETSQIISGLDWSTGYVFIVGALGPKSGC